MKVKYAALIAFAFLSAGLYPALATPARTAVFVGDGPRGRGCVEWLRLVASSPELELHLVDAFASAEELLAYIRREASCAAEARCQR